MFSSHRRAPAHAGALAACVVAAAVAVSLLAVATAEAAMAPASQFIDPNAGYNGCGPADDPFKRALVPNGIPGTTVIWIDACHRHDKCYETLRADKDLCDKDLGRDVTQLCRDGGLLFGCDAIGRKYREKVSELGDKPYADAQQTALRRCVDHPELYVRYPGYCPNADDFMWIEICAVTIRPPRYTPNRIDSCDFNVPAGGWWADNQVAYNPEAVRALMLILTANDDESHQHYFKLKLTPEQCLNGPAPAPAGQAQRTTPGLDCIAMYGDA